MRLTAIILGSLVLLAIPGTASAAAPQCEVGPFLYQLPAGSTWTTPRLPCTDADGDALSVEITDAPEFGTFDPSGALPIDAFRHYTANPGATGTRDSMKLRAVANGEASEEVTWDVWILPPNRAPACSDLALSVQAGTSIAVPVPSCTDADDDRFFLSILDGPGHGTYSYGMYKPDRGFTGQDSMGFQVIDEWRAPSAAGRIAITVTPAPPPGSGPNGSADKQAPRLDLAAPSSLRARKALRRGIRFTATASEAGRLVVQALVDRATARRLGIDREVGSLARDVAAGETTVRLKLDRRARKRLKRLDEVRLRLIVRISDAAGNTRTARLKITLKRD